MFLFCVPTLQRAEYLFRALDEVPGIVKYFYPDEYARGGYLLEVYPAGASKATAIEKVKAMTGAADIVSFGDNINDLPMFAASRISCAVANAAPRCAGPQAASSATTTKPPWRAGCASMPCSDICQGGKSHAGDCTAFVALV